MERVQDLQFWEFVLMKIAGIAKKCAYASMPRGAIALLCSFALTARVIAAEVYTDQNGVSWRYSMIASGGVSVSPERLMTDLVIPSEVNGMPVEAVSAYPITGVRSIRIPRFVKQIEINFALADRLEVISVESENQKFEVIDGVLYERDYHETVDQKKLYPDERRLVYCPSSVERIVIPRNVTAIGGYSTRGEFRDVDWGGFQLKEICVEEGNKYGFSSDGGLLCNRYHEVLKCPMGCEGVVIIPQSVVGVEREAFNGCARLESIKVEDGHRNLASFDGALYSADGSDLLAIPGAVSSFVVRKGAKRILSASASPSLRTIDIPDGVEVISYNAFKRCCSLEGVVLPSTVKEIGECAFSSAGKMVFFVNSSAVHEIPRETFYKCNALRDIQLGDNLVSIGEGAFWGCRALERVVFPKTLNRIDANAFTGSGLQDLRIEGDNLEVRRYAFSSTPLKSVSVSSRVKSIDGRAFAYCEELKTVDVDEESPYYRMSNGGLYDRVAEALVLLPNIDGRYNIENGVQRIGSYAFAYHSDLESVDIPASVHTVGYEAFLDCAKLVDVVWTNGLLSVESSAFEGCVGLESVDIPSTVSTIEDYAFRGCENLKSVKLPDALEALGEFAFSECVSLNEVVIPSLCAEIGDSAFKGCSGLTHVVMSKGVACLGESVFEDCTSLTSLLIPSSVVELGNHVVAGCSQLVDFAFAGNAPELKGSIKYNRVDGVWSWEYEPADIFVGTPTNLITRVKPGSSGWAESSIGPVAGLPQEWPAQCDNARRIAYDPNIEDVVGDAVGDRRVRVTFVVESDHQSRWSYEWLLGKPYVAPSPWFGHESNGNFIGWDDGSRIYFPGEVYTPSEGGGVLTAIFGRCVVVLFEGNGGTVGTARIVRINEDDFRIPDVGASRDGYTLMGWSLLRDGDAVYETGDVVDIVDGISPLTLYAIWQKIHEEDLPEPWELLDADKFGDLSYETSDWQVVACDEPRVGAACLMAALEENCNAEESETSFVAQVRGTGTVSFFWRTSCDEDPDGTYTWDRAEFRVDGETVAWCDGITDWEEIVYPIAGEGIHTLAWVYCVDGYPAELEGVEDRVWVGGIAWSGSDYEEELQPLVEPVIDPADGATFSDESCTVTIASPTKDVTIYYSTSGRTPSATEAYRYNGPFSITKTTTVKAVAVRGTEKSAYVTAVITKVDPPPQPVSYTIAYENLCGATHGNPLSYESGLSLVFAAPSEREGYSFEGWTPSAITSEMTGNIVVVANWKEMVPESPYVVQEGVLVGYNGAIPSELIIPNEVAEIAEGLFEGKIDIDVVEIPASLVRIPSGMFSGESKGYPLTTDAYGVKEFRVVEGNPRYRVINGMLYDYVDKIVVAAEVGISGCVTLPEDCRIVGDSAFQAKHLMADVVMPDSLERLDYKAFSECSSLTNLDFSVTSLSYVGEKCFKDSWNIVGVRFPETLSIIDEKAFASAASQFEGEATALKEVYFSGDQPSVIGSLYPGDADVTTYVMRGNGWDSYVQGGTWQNKPIRYFDDDVGDVGPRVISINFSDREAYTMSMLDGFDGGLAGTNILAASWNDYSTAATNGASVARMWDGREVALLENVQLSYVSGGRIWGPHSNGNSPSSQFMNMYLDDMQGASVSISIENVPFEKYDVIVYYQGDTDSNRFKPVCINGAWYSHVDGETIRVADFAKKPIWGIPNQPQLAIGVNAIRINGIAGKDLDVSPGVYEFIDGVKCRSTIAALQIVEAEGEYRVESCSDVTSASAAEALPDADEYNLVLADGATFEVDCALTRHYNIVCDGSVNLVGDDALKFAALEKLHFAGVTGEVVIQTTTDVSVENAVASFAYVVDGGTLKLNGVAPARIQVNVGGTFDVNGVADISYPIYLNGGTLANSGAAIGEGKKQWWTVTLLADSFIDARSDFGMIASGWAAFDFHSNGHRLTKRGTGTLFLARVSFVGGCTLVVEEGTVLDHDGLSSFDNVEIELAGGTMRLGGTSNKFGRFVATQNCSTLYWLSNQSNSICSDDTRDDPFVRVNKGAELRVDGKDFSGWLGDLTEHGWFVSEGTLRFTAGTGTRFFRDHLLLGDGSSVKIDHGSTSLLLYGGAGTEESCQIMVPSGTAVIASGETGTNARIYLGNSSTGSYGTKGAGVSVGRDATLTVNVSVDGPDTLTKWGDGRLTCTKAVTCPVVLAGGSLAVLQENAIPDGRITSGRPDARIVSSVDGGYVVYRLMVGATVGKDVTGLDKPVTVPASWVTEVLAARYGVETASAFRAQFGENLAEALSRQTGKVDVNGKALTVWDDYVAGTDPTDLTSRLKTIIEIVDGKVRVSWEPNLNDGVVERRYTLWGRKSLADGEWHRPVKDGDRFFRVKVDMPSDEESDVPSVIDPAKAEEGLGGVQLWEGGPYWAECNVGATKPEEYGYYFWWGDTIGYRRNASDDGWDAVDGSRTDFLFSGSKNCPSHAMSIADLQSAGYVDSTETLTSAHDAAAAYLGEPWRMPTAAECEALINNCDTAWTMRNGVYGYNVKGRGQYSSKSIFLPAAGGGNGTDLTGLNRVGYYWTSTPNSEYSWDLGIHSGAFDLFYGLRDYGRSIRPVRGLIE